MRNVVSLFAIGLILSVASCASTESKRGPEIAKSTAKAPLPLEERAKGYWTAKSTDNWDQLFSYLQLWQQNAGSPEAFAGWSKKNEPLDVNSYKILDVQKDDWMGWVRVKYKAALREYPNLPERELEVWQRWRKVDNQWFPLFPTDVDAVPEAPTERDQAEEEELRRRFDETWQARVDRDWSRLYDTTDPRDHAEVSLSDYAESEGLIDYISHDVRWVEVIGEHGRVRVNYHHKLTDPSLTKLPARDLEVTEQWIRIKGVWYRDLIHK